MLFQLTPMSSMDYINLFWNFTVCRYKENRDYLFMNSLLNDSYLAIINNEFDKFVILIEKSCELTINLSICAAKQPDYRYLNLLYEKGCPWNAITFRNAIEHGDISRIQWLRDKRCPWDESVCCEAGKYGKLDILQWLRQEGCPWDWTTGFYTAKAGHISILEWIYKNECPYISAVIDGAVYSRKLAVLQWFHEKNMINSDIAYQTIAMTNQVDMMDWLYLHYPLPSDSLILYLSLSHHSLSIIIWLIQSKKFSLNIEAGYYGCYYKAMSLGRKYDIPTIFLWGRKNVNFLSIDEEEYLKKYENIYTHLDKFLIPDLVGVIRQYY